MMRGIAGRIVLFAVASTLLGGCLAVGPQEEQRIAWYHVETPAPPAADREIDAAVALRPFAHDGALDPEEIRYRSSDVEGGYYSNDLWVEPVSGIVRSAIQADLQAWGEFRRVLLMDNAGGADLLVTGVVHRFEEEDRPEGWFAVVEMTIEATGAVGGNVVWHRRIREEEPCREKTVPEVVRALGRALGRACTEVRSGLAGAAR